MGRGAAVTTAEKIRRVADRYRTHTDAAKAAGMQPQQLSDLVCGRKSPRLDTLRRLAEAWGVTVAFLVGE